MSIDFIGTEGGNHKGGSHIIMMENSLYLLIIKPHMDVLL